MADQNENAPSRGAVLACRRGGIVTNSTTDASGRCPACNVEVGGMRRHQPSVSIVIDDLAAAIGEYMETRSTPWPDVAAMREAVNEAVRLLVCDAHIDTREVMKVIHGR